jgi:hypothetical protein
MNVISFTLIKQLPQTIEYMLFQGTQADCLKGLAEHFPHYDPGTCYWCEKTQQLWVPANYNGGAKAAK